MSILSVSNPQRALGRVTAGRAHVPLGVNIGLSFLFLASLLAGLQQQFAPRSFYDNFPGFGRSWVSIDGPFNEHLMRDLGGANLALAIVMLFAIMRPSAGLVRAVALALLVAQVPHFAYHAVRLRLLPTLIDQVLQTLSLSLVQLVACFVLVRAGSIRDESDHSTQHVAINTAKSDAPETRLIAHRP